VLPQGIDLEKLPPRRRQLPVSGEFVVMNFDAVATPKAPDSPETHPQTEKMLGFAAQPC
jgi:hypothetical protein